MDIKFKDKSIENLSDSVSVLKSALGQSEEVIVELKQKLNLSADQVVELNQHIKDIEDNKVSDETNLLFQSKRCSKPLRKCGIPKNTHSAVFKRKLHFVILWRLWRYGKSKQWSQ